MTNGLLSLASIVAANIWNEKVGVIHVIPGVFSLANATGVAGRQHGSGVGGGKEWALRSWISFKVNKRKDPTMLKATKQSRRVGG